MHMLMIIKILKQNKNNFPKQYNFDTFDDLGFYRERLKLEAAHCPDVYVGN